MAVLKLLELFCTFFVHDLLFSALRITIDKSAKLHLLFLAWLILLLQRWCFYPPVVSYSYIIDLPGMQKNLQSFFNLV